MGLRPNQPRRLVALARCEHAGTLVPVQVHDRLDGRPETVAHLCPDCYEPVEPQPRPPHGPASVARPGRSTGDLGPG